MKVSRVHCNMFKNHVRDGAFFWAFLTHFDSFKRGNLILFQGLQILAQQVRVLQHHKGFLRAFEAIRPSRDLICNSSQLFLVLYFQL